MNKLFYPAIFHKAEEGGYWITFPDFPQCMTEGDDMQEAYEMAVDVLGLGITDLLERNIELPKPSELDNINIESDAFCVIVDFDLIAYKKRTNAKAVKKTLSIPEWLNEEATAANINFSKVLQDALISTLRNRA